MSEQPEERRVEYLRPHPSVPWQALIEEWREIQRREEGRE